MAITHTHPHPGKLLHTVLWAVPFLEGTAVMVPEAMTAKYLTPIYGETLQVWGTSMGVTLVGLAMGYFLGGYLSGRAGTVLWWVLAAASAWLMLTPALALRLIPVLVSGDLVRDSLLLSIALLLPPLALVGMTPGLVVAQLSQGNNAGEVSGRVFAFSTIGSILAIFVTGFWAVPNFGVTVPLLTAGAMLAVPPLVVLLQRRRWWVLLLPIALVLGVLDHSSHRFPQDASLRTLYYSEGILGQVLVGDFDFQHHDGKQGKGRALYVNRVPQTTIDLGSGEALFSPYIDFVDYASGPAGKGDALLLGLGGGNLVRRFRAQGRKVDVCELDARVVEASRNYFHRDRGDAGTRYYTDDARHFLRTAPDRYQTIIFDIFKGENPPHHAFTREAFEETKARLLPGGFVVINFLGRTEGPRSQGPRAVIRTLQAAGYGIRVLAIPRLDNVIVMASPFGIPQVDARVQAYEVPLATMPLGDVPILVDDRPVLELLTAETSSWNRNWYNQNFTYRFLKENIPLFR
jgi:predicted membrane-bound spermidine synthase